MEEKLGKIQKVKFGHVCGRDSFGLGISFMLGGESWSVIDAKNGIYPCSDEKIRSLAKEEEIKHFSHCKEVLYFIHNLLEEAQVNEIQDLRNKPVMVKFNSNYSLHSWRILTECI